VGGRAAAAAHLAKDDDLVRLVVFSGAGEKAFVSGADISQFEDMRAAREAVAYYEKMAETTLMGIHDFPSPRSPASAATASAAA
jgi:enoyl-CoA hydratase